MKSDLQYAPYNLDSFDEKLMPISNLSVTILRTKWKSYMLEIEKKKIENVSHHSKSQPFWKNIL